MDARGNPIAGATVEVFVRPPGEGRIDLIPLAKATTDLTGKVSVTGLPTRDALSAIAPDGTVDLVMLAQKGGATSDPRMATVKLSALGTVDFISDGFDMKELKVYVATEERPLAEGTRTAGLRGGVVTTASVPTCKTSLMKWNTVRIGDTAQHVSQALIEQDAAAWTLSSRYENTNSTSLQTGSAVVAGTGPLSFSASGSVTKSSSLGGSTNIVTSGQSGTSTNKKHRITISHYYDEYRCWTDNSTPPASPGYWPLYKVVTVPGTWQYDSYWENLGNTAPSCPNANTSTYSTGSHSRVSGTSYTIESAFTANVSVSGKAGSFAGDGTVKTQRTSGQRVVQTFQNTATGDKHLCGLKQKAIFAATGNVGLIVAKL